MSTKRLVPNTLRAQVLSVSFGLLAAGCLDLRNDKPNPSRECTACHGDASRSTDKVLAAAPPFDADGNTGPSAPGVGAHAQHLTGQGHAAIACTECHVVPESVYSEGHVDSDFPAELTFGKLAKQGGQAPKYDEKSHRCSNSYCHGSAEVTWTKPRDGKTACGTCHGLPPALPHPQVTDCSKCHGEVIAADGSFKRPELHVNGKVDVKLSSQCNSCHGSDNTGAPPPDLKGSSDPSSPGAGAHATHLVASATHAAVACDACHVVPKTVEQKGHIDGETGAEVTFGALAKTNNLSPNYTQQTQSCTSTYCHGNATPKWTNPRTSDKACGSCHGLPPALPHPQNAACSQCHSAVIGSNFAFTHPELHINGVVNFGEGPLCSQCHGTGLEGAPPKDLAGNAATTAPGVGAHQLHVTDSATHGKVACSECHQVPTSLNSAGHLDGDGRAEVTFGTLANTGGKVPAYAAQTQSCTSTYCHGTATPNWTAPRSSDTACGTCHGLPPALPHPQNQDCSQCHGTVVGPNKTITNPELHINGTVNFGSGALCSQCHGSGAEGAPPKDLSGNSDTGARGVGAHQIHLTSSTTHGKIACSECHLVPATAGSQGHLDGDGRAEVTFGALAKTRGKSPTYDASSVTCQNTYCHGAAAGVWQAPRSAELACGSCHALPPPAPHPPRQDCVSCHGDVIAADGTIVSPSRHVDGKVDLLGSGCSLCHGSAANAAPPRDISGSSDPARIGIGAHQAHLASGKVSRPVPCGDCHVVPASVNDPGHLDSWSVAEVQFSGAAVARFSNVTWNHATASCTGSYCHDPSRTGNQPPAWTAKGTVFTCTSCHQMPPPAPHTTLTQCSFCHANVDAANNIIDPSLHVNGSVDIF